jgi:hypothetical protein
MKGKMMSKKEIVQFVVKFEWEKSFSRLTDEEKGILFQVFFDHHNNKELNFKDKNTIEAVWYALEPNIKRINENYITSVENGKLGGAPKGVIPWNKGKKKGEPNRNLNTNLKEPNGNLNTNLKEPNGNQTLTLKEKENEKEEVASAKNNTSTSSGNFLEKLTIETDKEKIEFNYYDFGMLNHKEKYEYFHKLLSGLKIIVGGDIITKEDFLYIHSDIVYDEDELELDKNYFIQ